MKFIAEMFERYKRSGDTSFAGGLMYEASKEWDAYLAANSVETEDAPDPEPGQVIPTSPVNEPQSTSQEHGQMFAGETELVAGIEESNAREAEENPAPEPEPEPEAPKGPREDPSPNSEAKAREAENATAEPKAPAKKAPKKSTAKKTKKR